MFRKDKAKISYRMSAKNGQIICADMFVNDVIVGRSSANLDTSDSTTILDLETTNTLDMNYELKAGDEVKRVDDLNLIIISFFSGVCYVELCWHHEPHSVIHEHQIFFTGEYIRGL